MQSHIIVVALVVARIIVLALAVKFDSKSSNRNGRSDQGKNTSSSGRSDSDRTSMPDTSKRLEHSRDFS